MISYDKKEIKDSLSLSDIFDLLQEFGGEPEYSNFGILSSTICHNKPGEGSRKLYFYENSGLFICYTGCEEPRFDIFELTRKVYRIQKNKEIDLNEAIRWVAQRFGISGQAVEIDEESLEDWSVLDRYSHNGEFELKTVEKIELKEYNKDILDRFNYKVKIEPWLSESISQEILDNAKIGFYPGADAITIPHFDADNRFIGLRGRTLCKEEANLYGKYRPLKVNQMLYNHPLGFNLYGLNWSKEAIKAIKKVIIWESEKSFLKYASYFGWDNNISVAVCGSSISAYQMKLLLDLNIQEVIIGFDKQYQELNTDESRKWKKKLLNLHNKYKNDVNISIIWDKKNLIGYKSSPIDEGKDKFLQLFKDRVIL